MKTNRLLLGCTFLLVLWMTIGCNKHPDAQQEQAKTESKEPVTLLVYLQAAVSDEDFKLLFSDPVKNKYPNITLETIHPKTGTRIEDLITSGTVPDLIATTNSDFLSLSSKDLVFDITPLVQKQKIDLNRFDTASIVAAKSDKGELWGLPYAMEFMTMYYNKDIFDKFGVSYPKDGMTWEDTIELANKVTSNIDGVPYRGLDVVNSNLMSYPFALTYTDGKTNKASVNNDQWKRVFELTKQIQSITGNEPPAPESSTSTIAGLFTKDRNIAMVVSPNLMKYFGDAAAGLNWDIAQYPSYKEKPNISGKVDSHNLVITKTSNHKDEAIKVLEVVTSDEVQLLNVKRTSRLSPLKNPEMQKQYGAELPYLKGKNIQAIFKSKVVAPASSSLYETDAKKIGQQKFKDYLSGTITDVNTALFQADDEINKMLASKK